MIFDCPSLLFQGGECEWTVIRGFVATYNQGNGTQYERAQCLDVAIRNSSQPEVRLTCQGRPDIVVERKTVVWPENHIKQHEHFHRLSDLLIKQLRPHLPHGVFELWINERDVCSCADLGGSSTTISCAIQRDNRAGGEPFPWRLVEVDPDPGEIGRRGKFSIVAQGQSGFDKEPDETRKSMSEAFAGFSSNCSKMLNEATKKFEGYPDSLKIVLLQFVGEDDLVLDDDIEKIIEASANAGEYDEIWVAYHEWVNEEDYEIGWKRAWSAKNQDQDQ